mmetsp:Transcript_24457/g.48999  ORF Transcript_24457/g.48999 Transcript_24457/m.48999 type:complete len:230 (+) Transcript_24457:398-1087(+)
MATRMAMAAAMAVAKAAAGRLGGARGPRRIPFMQRWLSSKPSARRRSATSARLSRKRLLGTVQTTKPRRGRHERLVGRSRRTVGSHASARRRTATRASRIAKSSARRRSGATARYARSHRRAMATAARRRASRRASAIRRASSGPWARVVAASSKPDMHAHLHPGHVWWAAAYRFSFPLLVAACGHEMPYLFTLFWLHALALGWPALCCVLVALMTLVMGPTAASTMRE